MRNDSGINALSPLGKGEVDSSILSGSTSRTPVIAAVFPIVDGTLSGINRQNVVRTYSWSPWKNRGQMFTGGSDAA